MGSLSMLTIPPSDHDGLLGLSVALVSSPPDLLVLVRLLGPLQERPQGSSILTPARASSVSCGTLGVLTRTLVGPAHRLLN